MTIHKHITSTVASCIPTHDGVWLVQTTSGHVTSSPLELEKGEPVTFRAPLEAPDRKPEPRLVLIRNFPVSAALASFQAIDRVRS